MNNQQNKKKYVLVVVTQLVTIAAFIGAIYFMFNQEKIVLNPVPYAAGVGVVMLLIDYVILTKIFKENKVDSQALDTRDIV